MKLHIAKADLIDLLSKHIRGRYIEFRRTRPGDAGYEPHPKWDGGTDTRGSRHQPIWPKIAEFMFEHRLNVSACLALRFELSDHSKMAPMPNTLMSQRHLPDFRRVSEVSDPELRYSLRAEKSLCRVEMFEAAEEFDMNGKPVWRYVIGNDELGFSPLFRFCLAYSEDLDDLADSYKLEAILQYVVAMDNYDKAWGNWIPDAFRRQVRLAYDRTVANRNSGHGKKESKTTRHRKKAPPR